MIKKIDCSCKWQKVSEHSQGISDASQLSYTILNLSTQDNTAVQMQNMVQELELDKTIK